MKPSPSSPNLTYLRFWRGLGWLALAVVVVLTVMPSPPEVPVISWDKAQHFLVYTALMWWFSQTFTQRGLWMILLIALGIGLEGVQGLGHTRYPELADVLANALGVGLGTLLATTPLGRALAWIDQRLLPRVFSSHSY